MQNFPIVDAHVHLWDPGRLRYPWLDDLPTLNKAYLLPDYRTASQSQQVEKLVFIQCEAEFAQFMDEAEWIGRLAEQNPQIAAIVPWAPIETGDAVRSALHRLVENPRVTGVRRVLQSEPDLDFCLRPDFVKGVRALADYGLSFDICITHIQLENVIRLVRQCPNVRFILDHIGKPDIQNHILDPWRAHITALAELENVCCKVSGLVTEADLAGWMQQDLKPYIDHVVTCFGFDRVMFGSDWPVVVLAASWERWVNTLLGALAGVSQADLAKVFRDNATAFYRLT